MSECLNCGKKVSTRYNKYCNSKCSGEHRAKVRLDKYILEDNFSCPNKQLPLWLKDYIREDEGKCSCCGIKDWNGEPIVFDVDHIDGDYKNNARNNLRAICPNCHSQTSTYKGRNKGKGRGSH